MNIAKYTGFFHDGSLIGIENIGNDIVLSPESSEINPIEIEDMKLLSKSNTLFGKLRLKNVTSIKLDHKLSTKTLRKTADDGEILSLEISQNKIVILIEWVDFPPKPRSSTTNTIELEAEHVIWENMPWADGYKFCGTKNL